MDFKEIITPTSNEYTLNLPDDMIGEQIEITASKIESVKGPSQEEKVKKLMESAAKLQLKEKISEIRGIFKDSLVDLRNYKFDRDEANNYDE